MDRSGRRGRFSKSNKKVGAFIVCAERASNNDPGHNDPGQRKSERIVFHGRVQGVGFRYSVRSLAKHYPVMGYVRNLPDGTVELVVQGGSRAVADFVLRIAEQFRGNISRIDRSATELADSLSGFEIRF